MRIFTGRNQRDNWGVYIHVFGSAQTLLKLQSPTKEICRAERMYEYAHPLPQLLHLVTIKTCMLALDFYNHACSQTTLFCTILIFFIVLFGKLY